jgi:D-alanyl-D-alanine carboxypeptidase
MTTWDRDLYTGRLLPARQQHQLESLVSKTTGKPIRRTTAADPAGYGLGVQQVFNPQTGIIWDYEGQAFGARVIHYYFPRTGLLIAVAANSSTITNDDLSHLSGAVYQTLHKAGTIPAS